MNNDKVYTERRGSLIILAASITIIVILVIIGICVVILLEEEISKLILFILVALVIIVGILSFIFLECQRREAQRKKDLGAQEWVRSTLEEQVRLRSQTLKPSASTLSGHTSWAYTTPFRYSQRSTLPAR